MLHRSLPTTLAAFAFVFSMAVANAQGTFEVNTNRYGGDIANFQIGPNPIDCQRACVQSNICSSWSYVQNNQTCYLKGSPQTPTPAPGVFSGLVRGGRDPQETFKKFSGTWIWADRRRGTLPATLEFYPNRQGDARYCYPSSAGQSCFDIRYTVQGSAYVFTRNGVDWFSMSSPKPGVLNGRYWDRRADVNLPPSAKISMRQTAGSRP